MEASVERGGWLRHVSAWAHHRHGPWALGGIAFADSSFLPVPPDILLVPMALLRPERLKALLLICVVGSSLGAIVGYVIGYWLWSSIGLPMVELYGYTEKFTAYQQLVAEWGVLVIIVKAFTPIPFKIAAIAAGVAAMNPWAFIVATIVGRSLHFAMVYALLTLFGARITLFVARYERPLAVVSVLALIGLAVFCYLR
jgi:membrane protein YqaA with SNARE-associated domain